MRHPVSQKIQILAYRISSNSFRGNYSFLNLALCTVIFVQSNYRCGNHSREETIQGRKLFAEIPYQLTLSQPGGADYAHHINTGPLQIFRTSYGPAKCISSRIFTRLSLHPPSNLHLFSFTYIWLKIPWQVCMHVHVCKESLKLFSGSM